MSSTQLTAAPAGSNVFQFSIFEWFPTGGARANIDILKSKYSKLREDAIKHQEFIEAYQRMKTNFSASNEGRQLYKWQELIGVCSLLKVDATCIAPTGAGKTIPIVLPLYAARPGANHMILVISPLKELEYEQVRHNSDHVCSVHSHSAARSIHTNGLSSGSY
jgi:hypothetical protein